MVRPRARALFPADRCHPGIEQIAEEFPAGRRFIGRNAQRFGHPVGGGTGRHGAGNAVKARSVTGRQMRIRRQHGERVRRGHETRPPDDEITVPIAIGRRAEIRRVRRHHQIVQRFGVDQIGVGVMTAKIFQRHTVAHGAGGKAQTPFEDLGGIRAGHGVHRVKGHGVAGRDRRADRVEIKQAFHQRGIIGDRVDHLDRQIADLRFA